MKKVAIVTAHFMPELGYQEVYLARSFSRLGYDVMVFTSTAISPTGRKVLHNQYNIGISEDKVHGGYKILRLRPIIQAGAKVIVKGLHHCVNDFSPDVIIIVGASKLFPYRIISNKFKNKYKIITVFSDAREYQEHLTGIKRMAYGINHYIIKKWMYNKVSKYSDRIILNLPETRSIFHHYISKKYVIDFETKYLLLRLGFDPNEFYFDPSSRDKTRKELNIGKDEVVFITSTRVNFSKKLEQVINGIEYLSGKGYNISYILIGFHDDEYGKKLKIYIQKKGIGEKVRTFPFLDRDKIRALYSAADIGIWTKAAISIQQAMGTGLPIITKNRESVSHVVKNEENGWLYDDGELYYVLKHAIDVLLDPSSTLYKNNRSIIAQKNADKFSYDTISIEMLKGFWYIQ